MPDIVVTGGSTTAHQLNDPILHSNSAFKPTAATYESYPRQMAMALSQTLTSGTLFLTCIYLPINTPVTNIAFHAGTTAATTPTNQWFSLLDSSRNVLAKTADDTTTAWAANTLKTLAVTGGAYTTTASGLYYLGILVAATTPPTIAGQNASIVGGRLSPSLWGESTAALTTPATLGATAAAITAGNTTQLYGYIN